MTGLSWYGKLGMSPGRWPSLHFSGMFIKAKFTHTIHAIRLTPNSIKIFASELVGHRESGDVLVSPKQCLMLNEDHRVISNEILPGSSGPIHHPVVVRYDDLLFVEGHQSAAAYLNSLQARLDAGGEDAVAAKKVVDSLFPVGA